MKHILIADDEPHVIRILKLSLERAGYRVDSVPNGEMALERTLANPPDALITDIQMPKMDGIQLLKGIKGIDPTTPVIIMTAYASEQSAIDAVNLGAFSYMQKHCKNDEIKMVVRNALALKQVTSENVQLKQELTRKTKLKKIIGSTTRPRIVVENMPPTIGAAILFITSAPVPCDHMIGSSPAMIAVTVMAMGRTRWTAPAWTASRRSDQLRSRPSSWNLVRLWLRYITIMTPISVETPTKAITPTHTATERSYFNAASSQKAPTSENGIAIMTRITSPIRWKLKYRRRNTITRVNGTATLRRAAARCMYSYWPLQMIL